MGKEEAYGMAEFVAKDKVHLESLSGSCQNLINDYVLDLEDLSNEWTGSATTDMVTNLSMVKLIRSISTTKGQLQSVFDTHTGYCMVYSFWEYPEEGEFFMRRCSLPI